MNEISLGRVAGLKLSAKPSAVAGSMVLWAALTGAGVALLHVPLRAAIVGGFVAMLLHWASDVVHHLGHAWMARRTGYPMTGISLWMILGTSLYPPDEPVLPASVHIRRAVGGPIASGLASIVALVVALALRPLGGVAWLVAAFLFLDNLFFLTLGALMPLGFTDGSTLLEWRGKL